MTFLQMQTRVGNLINRAVTDDNGLITETEVKAFLNIGYHRAVNAVVGVNDDFYVREAKADIVANQKSYALPTDLRKLKQVKIAYESTSDYQYAKKIDLNIKEDPEDTQPQSTPIYFLVDKHIEFDPVPDTNVTDGLILYYVESQADLSDDADTPDLPIGYEDIPILYAVAKAKQKLGLDGEAQAYLGEFEAELGKMTDQIAPRTIDAPGYVKIVDYME